ncbi:MAG TPA: hypothetical protein VIX59_19730 [Candidatus Binataceae bacterium]
MAARGRPRFISPAAALRFYFRVHELFRDNQVRPFTPLPNGDVPSGGCVIVDYLEVDGCVRGLDDFQAWLLAELYGPTGFAAHQRTVARACAAAQLRFPDRRITLCMLGRMKRLALEAVAARLHRAGLITCARTQGAASHRAGRMHAV